MLKRKSCQPQKTDQEEIFPRENIEKSVKQGIMAIPFPVYIAALEMLAKACANTALQVSIQGMICEGIRLFGDDRQKNEFLKEKELVEGRSLASFALTEPCCGSDAKSIQTKEKTLHLKFLKPSFSLQRWLI